MITSEQDLRAYEYLRNRVLDAGEELVWSGRPARRTLAAQGMGAFFYAILFFGFAVFWTVMASQGSLLFAAFGIPFLAVGFWMLITPVRLFFKAGRLYYAITDKRVIILSVSSGFKVQNIYPDDITDLEVNDFGDDRGSIQLQEAVTVRRGNRSRITRHAEGLWGIQDFRTADKAIRRLKESERLRVETFRP